jgi:hypothetical protein
MTLRTYPQAAAEMQIPQRTLRELVRRHQPPVVVLGRRVLFDDQAIAHIIEACRRCPCASPAATAPASSGSPAPSAAGAFARVLALTTPASPKNSAPRAKPRSTVLRFTAPARS